MATKKKVQNKPNSPQPAIDLTLWFSTLSYFPPEKKGKLWMAEAIFFAKKNSVLLLDPYRCQSYRQLNNLVINPQTYINLVDPPTPEGIGGTASYFSSDFKANPINIHLHNITNADALQHIPASLTVSVVDPVAKTEKQRDNDRVIYQREVTQMINHVFSQLGIAGVKDGQDPYDFIKRLGNGEGDEKAISALPDVVGYIRNQIKDSQDLMLYNTYIYKSDIEKAFELGIQHYLINENKWKDDIGEYFLTDIRNFNIASGRVYTDKTTGRKIVRYIDPETLYTSPFKRRNGEDIMYWFHEDTYTFADFVRMFGAELDETQLKEVFLLNKQQGAQHGQEWNDTPGNMYGSNAMITIGFFSILTQDTEMFSEGYVMEQNVGLFPQDINWEAGTDGQKPVPKTYNVWYSCYYIPPPAARLNNNFNAMADYVWQSQYVFDLHKNVDQNRYGEDLRYAKSELVIWRDIRPSFTDIEQAFMPKIHNLWHKFQNCLVQDTVGLVIADDFLASMLESVDEANKNGKGNGKNAAMEQWKQLSQSGLTFLRLRDKNGNLVQDPSKFFIPIDSKHIDKAERYLTLILGLYQQMTLALAFSDQAEGQQGDARVSVEAIQSALLASTKGRWFIEHAYSQICVMFAERIVKYIYDIVQEKDQYNYTERWEQFMDVVGKANALELEGIEKIHLENIGVTVSDQDTKKLKAIIDNLAINMAQTKQINPEILGVLLSEPNYKYCYSLIIMSMKQQEQIASQQSQYQFEQQMALKQKDLEIAQALQGSAAQAKNMNIQAQGNVDARNNLLLNQAKADTMEKQKQQILTNKLTENNQKANLKTQEQNQDELNAIPA